MPTLPNTPRAPLKVRRPIFVPIALVAGLLALSLLIAACAPVTDEGSSIPSQGGDGALAAPAAPETEPAASDVSAPPPTLEPASGAAAEAEIMTTDDRSPLLRNITRNWNTNWERRTINYDEILSGGPPRDGIPSIDDPQFVSVEAASAWLSGNEPVIALEIAGEARAYPLQILTWHEIVNDVVGDVPVAVTFCPLCNAAITFDRRLHGEVLEFGTSGLLRNSDLIMYDRSTESLWQQFTGEGIVGDLAGERLTFIPASLIGFRHFSEAYPEGRVLSRDTGHTRAYGQNPYVGYDDINRHPFLFDGPTDGRLPPMIRVVTVSISDTHVAYPLDILAESGVIHDQPAGQALVVLHTPGTASALDAPIIAASRDVGATGVFDPQIDGQRLDFRREGRLFIDEQTGSTWDITGRAIDGPLTGQQLTPILHANHFWFSWAAFQPDTIIYDGR